jgi:hypothetical protein
MRQKRLAKLEQTIQSPQSPMEDPMKAPESSRPSIRQPSLKFQESLDDGTSLRQTDDTKTTSDGTTLPQQQSIPKPITSVGIL